MMKRTTRLVAALSAAVLSACASSNIHSSVATSADFAARTHETGIHESRAVRLAADALRCMLGRGDDATCTRIAQEACIAPAAITRWNPSAIEQVSDRLDAIAREERLSRSTRGALLRWFDLASGAVREARAARAGAACARSEACRVRAHGSPAIDDVENAWRGDVRAVQSHVAFDALMACTIDAEDLAPEVQATALAVFAERLDAAANARPEVRTEAVRALEAIQTTLEGGCDSRDASAAPEAAAHESGDHSGATVEHARTALHRVIATTTTGGAVRVLVEVAQTMDLPVTEARVTANPCGA
jgi:hypothetical protein